MASTEMREFFQQYERLTFDTEKEWLDERRNSIGASEVAAALGLDPYCSPYYLFHRRRGTLTDDQIKLANPDRMRQMRAGKLIEPVVKQLYVEQTGRKIREDLSAPFMILRSKPHPFLHASIDDAVDPGPDDTEEWMDGPGVYEAKNTSAWRASEWKNDRCPLPASAQAMAGCVVTGFHWWSVAGYIGGWNLQIRDGKHDKEWEELVLPRLEDYLKDENAGICPSPDGSSNTTELIKHLYAMSEPGSTVLLEPAVVGSLTAAEEASRLIKANEKLRDECLNVVKEAMAEHDIGMVGSQKVCTWRQVAYTRAPLPEKHISYRAFKNLIGN